MNENNTQNGQNGTSTVASEASFPNGTVSTEAGENVSLKEINDYLGKNYKDKDSALKSLKDTFSFVGKKIETANGENQVAAKQPSEVENVAKQLREMRTELFYSKNPQYDTPEYRTIIGKISENPAEVVNSPEFKNIFDKAASFDKTSKQKTVLESNPRIGVVRNKLAEATEAVRNGDYKKSDELAVAAVMEAYDMQ
jgi:hypothetical protein